MIESFFLLKSRETVTKTNWMEIFNSRLRDIIKFRYRLNLKRIILIRKDQL